MLERRKPKMPTNYKLNLVPIMDAVFIFIFFLLFSAQFIKIFEHGSDVPIVSNQPPEKNKKDPLNLKVVMRTRTIKITTGLNGNILKTFHSSKDGFDYTNISAALIKLKKRHPKEEYVIISPGPDVKYEQIVKVMDSVRIIPGVLKKGMSREDIEKGSIFNKIVLEPIN